MKVLGIVGSPRKRGNTAKLVEAVMEGARDAGHDTEIFYLSELKIGPIEADGGKYVYPEDDMVKLYAHIEKMGALVLGTPIYYDHVSSRTKIFIDRLHYYSVTHGKEYRKLFPPEVKSVNIITYEWEKVDVYDDVLDWMKGRMEAYWGMKVAGSLKVEDTERRPAEKRRNIIEKAKEIGRSL